VQKWEYCRLHNTGGPGALTVYRGDGAQQFSVKADKTQGDRSDADAARRLIATLGLDGWELVGFEDAYGRNWVFKRPVS
jgi:hypothetical protein